WATAFSEAGLDITAFDATPPQPLPMGAFDSRLAWAERDKTQGRHIEAAALDGLPVYFRVMTAASPADLVRFGVNAWPLAVWILLLILLSSTIVTALALT